MVHKDICIQFEIEGRKFEAVGFLGANEDGVIGHTMLDRADNGKLISERDLDLLFKRCDQLPEALRKYRLVTSLVHPPTYHIPRVACCVYCLTWANYQYDELNGRVSYLSSSRWCDVIRVGGTSCLGLEWGAEALVLRHRS